MSFTKTVTLSKDEYFQDMRTSITQTLVGFKSKFQEIDENDIDGMPERLDSFCKNLRLVWDALSEYAREKKRQEIQEELQSYVDKGLQFQTIKVDCEQFHLKYKDNDVAEVVPGTGDDDHDIPF
jgi:hypothetical protein